MNSLSDCIELSVKTKTTKEIDVDFSVNIQGETWKAYSTSVSNRDILLFTDKGTCTFLVDSYGNKNVAELFDWSNDNG